MTESSTCQPKLIAPPSLAWALTHGGNRSMAPATRRPGARQEATGARFGRRPAGANRLPVIGRRTRPAARRQGTEFRAPGPTSPAHPRPQVIARATEIAGGTRQYDRALELTRSGSRSNRTRPRRANPILAAVLSNRIDDLAPQLASLLAQDKANLANNLMHINRMLAGTVTRRPYSAWSTASPPLRATCPKRISPWPRRPPMPATTCAP
jgi:hypothetical protein